MLQIAKDFTDSDYRLSHPKTKDVRDFPATEGTVFVMPYDKNKA